MKALCLGTAGRAADAGMKAQWPGPHSSARTGMQVYPRKPGWPARTAALVARWLEFGTSRTAKKPFMTQAFESHKQEALEAITDKLKEALKD